MLLSQKKLVHNLWKKLSATLEDTAAEYSVVRTQCQYNSVRQLHLSLFYSNAVIGYIHQFERL